MHFSCFLHLSYTVTRPFFDKKLQKQDKLNYAVSESDFDCFFNASQSVKAHKDEQDFGCR